MKNSNSLHKGKRVLFVSHIPVLPVMGGDRIRIWQALDYLLNNYQVDIAYLSHHKEKRELKDMEPRLGNIWKFQVSRPRRLLQASRTLFNSLPLEANLFHHSPMSDLIKQLAPNYDFIYFASQAAGANLPEGCKTESFIDMTDSLAMNRDNEALRSTNSTKRLFWKLEAKRWRNFELICAENFKRLAYIGSKDRFYAGISPDRTAIISNRVLLPKNNYQFKPENEKIITFIGKMDYRPNIMAVEFFSSQVFPSLRKAFPELKFRIVGMSPGKNILKLSNQDGIEVTGFVPDLNLELYRSTLVVAPMLTGSGIQNKILEAMAAGCCVVTTPLGAEGLEALKDALVISESIDDFKDATLDLLNHPELVEEYKKKAPAAINAHFNPAIINEQFNSFFNSIQPNID